MRKAFIITSLIFAILFWLLAGRPGVNSLKSVWPSEKSDSSVKLTPKKNVKSKLTAGQIIDNYKGINVYYNGKISHVSGRNKTSDGYNLGLKYQCVEFAKRFYYERYNHKMPNSYGHAKEFFDLKISHGSVNKARDMYQFQNGRNEKPRIDDLCIIGPSKYNGYGHLFVITKVNAASIEIIQQNPGPENRSREEFTLIQNDGKWIIDVPNLLGWLRMK